MHPILAATALLLCFWEIITSGLRLLPLPYFPSPAKVLQSLISDRGLLFLACNVRIAEQFEFIQKQWLNDGSPFGLGNIPDPVSGLWPHPPPRPLVIAGRPPVVRAELSSFVTTRGGEYFFAPSVPGLWALARR